MVIFHSCYVSLPEGIHGFHGFHGFLATFKGDRSNSGKVSCPPSRPEAVQTSDLGKLGDVPSSVMFNGSLMGRWWEYAWWECLMGFFMGFWLDSNGILMGWWSTFHGIYPLVMSKELLKMAIDIVSLPVWFSIAMSNYQRVCFMVHTTHLWWFGVFVNDCLDHMWPHDFFTWDLLFAGWNK